MSEAPIRVTCELTPFAVLSVKLRELIDGRANMDLWDLPGGWPGCVVRHADFADLDDRITQLTVAVELVLSKAGLPEFNSPEMGELIHQWNWSPD